MIIEGAQVDFGLVDQTIKEDNVVANTGGQTAWSDPLTAISDDTTKQKIAYLEKDYFLLDGTFIFPEEYKDYNVGYESDDIADENGYLPSLEYVEYRFDNTHESYGVQVYFDKDCIAKDFTIAYYKDTELIGEKIITNNKENPYVLYDVELGWNKVRISFQKVNPLQRARFTQITFGITDHYTENQLTAISASNSTDIVGDYSRSGEFSFTFFNDGRFDVQNIKDFSQGLQGYLHCTVYVKYQGKDAYEMFGTYYSEETSVQDNGALMLISGFDQLYMLNETTYLKGIVHTSGQSLAQWARDVAEDAGVAIQIDNEFEDIISYGYITDVPHREALRLIAEAGNGILLCAPDGTIQLKKLATKSEKELTNDEIVADSLSIENPDKTLGVNVTSYEYVPARTLLFADVDTITLNGTIQLRTIPVVGITGNIDDAVVYIRESIDGNEIPTDAGIQNIRIITNADTTQSIVYEIYGEAGETVLVGIQGYGYKVQELGYMEEVLVTGTAQTIEIVYSDYPAVTSSIKLYVDTTTPTILQNIKTYADRVIFDILTSDNSTTTSFVTVVGTPYNVATYNTERGLTTKNIKTVEKNYLITQNIADSVADYQYTRTVKKYDYELQAISDKDIAIEDKIVVQDNNIVVTSISFSLSADDNEVKITGVDE